MTNKTKTIILIAIILAAAGIIFWLPSGDAGDPTASDEVPKEAVFSITEEPLDAFIEALEDKRPIFLEFYAST